MKKIMQQITTLVVFFLSLIPAVFLGLIYLIFLYFLNGQSLIESTITGIVIAVILVAFFRSITID